MMIKGFEFEDEVFERILQCIRSKTSVLLVGRKGTGKTPILQVLADKTFLSTQRISTEDLFPVLVPITEILPFEAEKFYRRVLEEIIQHLGSKRTFESLWVQLIELTEKSGPINYVDFREVVEKLRKENIFLLILIDDIDSIVDCKDIDFYHGLRHLITGYSTTFVITTHKELYRLIDSKDHYSSPFYEVFKTIEIPEKEKQTAELPKEQKPGYEKITTKLLEELMAREVSVDWNNLEKKNQEEQFEILIEKICDEFIGNRGAFLTISTLVKYSKPLDFILHLTEKRYRDHHKHQFDVGALGWFLLNTNTGEQTLKKDICDLYSWREEEVARAWFATAFLHDHAYPISYLFELAPKLYHLKRNFGDIKGCIDRIQSAYLNAYHHLFSQELYDDLKIMLNDGHVIAKDLMNDIRSEFQLAGIDIKDSELRDGDIYDHGILSALNIIKNIKNNPENLEKPVIQKAVEAIAVHNLPFWNLCLEEKPLATLLVLCDEIQEWGRNLMVRHKYITELDQVMIGPFEKREGKRTFAETLNIRFEYSDYRRLLKTEWNFEIFQKSKMKQFGRLKLFSERDERNPKRIRYEIVMPYETEPLVEKPKLSREDTVLEALKKRYDQGKITKEEYEQLKSVVEKE